MSLFISARNFNTSFLSTSFSSLSLRNLFASFFEIVLSLSESISFLNMLISFSSITPLPSVSMASKIDFPTLFFSSMSVFFIPALRVFNSIPDFLPNLSTSNDISNPLLSIKNYITCWYTASLAGIFNISIYFLLHSVM